MCPTATAQPPVIVILGPTASGKSVLAHAVAKKIGAEIISADSRQIYRELDIGAAKPAPEALQEVPHHFVNEKNIGEPFTAGDFAIEAIERIRDIHRRGKRAIIAGGSTLYLEGVLKGFAILPPANPEIRERLLAELKNSGKERLYEKLIQKDPEQAATLDPTKTHRLIRSLEIIEITGLSVTELQSRGKQQQTDLHFLTTGLSIPRETLYQRINQRTDDMITTGLCHEAELLYHKYQKLLADKKTSALQSVGYQELFQYFENTIDFAEAVRLIKQHTRNYAKRQMTFFNNRLTVNWVNADILWEMLENSKFWP
ncbi:MAG: tRNA (adenosine(37)-N6)-dimethylallyltransferase MiaA [Chlorobiaceae bacterium]